MELSHPSALGTYEPGFTETVATYGRWYAAIEVAQCEDGLYRFSTSMQYSYGGFCGPIFAASEGFPTIVVARTAALEDLLAHWHKPFPSEPESVHDELRIMREQIEASLRQPSLF